MTYRDDRDALLHRADALERELAQVRAENERLQQAVAAEPAPVASAPAAAALVRATPLPLARPARHAARAPSLWAAGVVGAGWTAAALAVGAAAWMVPVAIASVLGAAWSAPRAMRWLAAWTPRRRWPTLPLDRAAYRDLLARERRSVVVQLDVTFVRPLARTDRERVRHKLRTAGTIRFDGGHVTILSGTLRTRAADAFDPTPIRAFCEHAFDRLVALHATHPLAAVRPRAKAR